jgi:hypothetical protein
MNLGLATPTPATEIRPIDVMERRDSISIREDSMPEPVLSDFSSIGRSLSSD